MRKKNGGNDVGVKNKWDFSCLKKLNSTYFLLPQVRIHAVGRGRLINFILFTSQLNFLKISSSCKNIKNTIICYTYS